MARSAWICWVKLSFHAFSFHVGNARTPLSVLSADLWMNVDESLGLILVKVMVYHNRYGWKVYAFQRVSVSASDFASTSVSDSMSYYTSENSQGANRGMFHVLFPLVNLENKAI